MNQYKHNIKEQSTVTELCALHQGSNETLEKYITRLKKVWQSIWSKLYETIIYGIFVDSILLVITQHALDYIEMGFGIMIERILAKDKVLIELGSLKYMNTTYNKDNKNVDEK